MAAIFFVFNITAQENKSMDKVHKIILGLEQKYAPDKRTAVFNVFAEMKNNRIVIKGETNIAESKKELSEKIIYRWPSYPQECHRNNNRNLKLPARFRLRLTLCKSYCRNMEKVSAWQPPPRSKLQRR